MASKHVHRPGPREECPTPKKLRFPTKRAAKQHIKRMRAAYDRDMLRPYRCKGTDHWHIGHPPGAGYRKLVKAGLIGENGESLDPTVTPESL